MDSLTAAIASGKKLNHEYCFTIVGLEGVKRDNIVKATIKEFSQEPSITAIHILDLTGELQIDSAKYYYQSELDTMQINPFSIIEKEEQDIIGTQVADLASAIHKHVLSNKFHSDIQYLLRRLIVDNFLFEKDEKNPSFETLLELLEYLSKQIPLYIKKSKKDKEVRELKSNMKSPYFSNYNEPHK